MTYIIPIILFLFGICLGSFLNVCIYRIPRKEDIVSTPSHCMTCGKRLKWFELIPVISFICLRGKCSKCHTQLSWQYPIVEIVNGLLWVWVYLVQGLTLEGLLFCICASTLLVISIIDWNTFEIPIGCNMLLLILGMIRMIGDLAHWKSYVLGFFVISGLFYLIYILSKGRAMGGGDIKLMAAAGLLLGWQGVLLATGLGSILGSIIHLSLMKLQKKDRVLAFGPYLSLGNMISMLYGDQIIQWIYF